MHDPTGGPTDEPASRSSLTMFPRQGDQDNTRLSSSLLTVSGTMVHNQAISRKYRFESGRPTLIDVGLRRNGFKRGRELGSELRRSLRSEESVQVPCINKMVNDPNTRADQCKLRIK